MKDIITVIVPIYNVEAYLEKCIQSILGQTYRELEIILVDDGSPDKCGEICNKYAVIDSRIIIIHKINGGLSDARNAGLEVASGDYIGFVDSDDYIHPQMYEKLMDMMIKKNADITICNLKHVSENHKENLSEVKKMKETDWITLDRNAAQSNYFDHMDIYTVAWNKLYKRELFEDIRYPKGKVHEDEFTTFKLLYRAKRVIYADLPLYNYLVRENSIMGQFNQNRYDLLEAYRERMRFYITNNEYKLWKRMVFLYMRMSAQYMQCVGESDELKKLAYEHRKKFKSLYRKDKDKVRFYVKDKMVCFLFFYCMPAYRLARFVFGILLKKKYF